MAKVSNIIIGMVVLFMVMGSFGLWTTGLYNEYQGINLTADNNQTFETYQKLQELNDTITDFRDKTDLEGDTNPADQIGRLLSQGFEAMKITVQAEKLAFQIITSAGEDTPLLSVTRPIYALGGGLIILIIMLFILISTLTKREQ